MPAGYDGPERRMAPRGPLEELVTKAARIAAQDVAQIHRRRLVRQTFVAALVAACVVSLPVVLYVGHQRAVDSRANSVFNCQRSGDIADVFGAFLRSDAKLRDQQRHYDHRADVEAAFGKLIGPKIIREIQARSERLDRETTTYWTDVLLPRLRRAVDEDCRDVIR